MIVDMHAHYVSPRMIEEARRNGADYGVAVDMLADGRAGLRFIDGPTLRPFFRELTDLAIRLPGMDAEGIGLQIVSTWTDMQGDDLPAEQGRRWARLQNETLAEDARAHPGRFEAMGTLPMQDLGGAIAELDHIVTRLGMRSIEMGTHAAGMELDHPELRPLWRRIAEHGVFVLLHPPFRPAALDRAGDYFLNNVVSFPLDTTFAAARLLFSGLMEEIPGLSICLAHAGGFLPYQIGRLDRGFAAHPACSRATSRRPSEGLRDFYFDTLTHGDEALAFLAERVGPDRLVYGSDYPFEMLDPEGPGRIARLAGIDAAARTAILSGNIGRALVGGLVG